MPPDKHATLHLDLTASLEWSHPADDAAEVVMREQAQARLELFITLHTQHYVTQMTQEFGAWLVSHGQADWSDLGG